MSLFHRTPVRILAAGHAIWPPGAVLRLHLPEMALSHDEQVNQRNMHDALFDAVALWDLAPATGTGEVVDTATDALVGGLDSPSLRELAGTSPNESYWTLRPLIEDTLSELGIEYPGPGANDVQLAAARVMCRRLLHGEIAPRQLASWAHQTIGHNGSPRLQALVELDDVYDEIDYIGQTIEEVDDEALAEARSIVERRPIDPSRTYAGPTGAAEPSSSQEVDSRLSLFRLTLATRVRKVWSYLRN